MGSEKLLYVSVGPITPIPGPLLARHEREVEIPSINPRPGSKYSVISEPSKKRIINIKKKTPTLRNSPSSKTLSPIQSLMTARGWITRSNSLFNALKRSIILTIFIPPVVEPAHPPVNMANNKTKIDIFGQSI